MSNLPEDIIDLVSKTEYLKINSELGEIKLEAHNQVNMQPKGTPFGTKLKLESDGKVTPTITFDSKKMRESKVNINAKQMLDAAIEEYLNHE
jgi:hypothetical protein